MLVSLCKQVVGILGLVWIVCVPLSAWQQDKYLSEGGVEIKKGVDLLFKGVDALETHHDRQAFTYFKQSHQHGSILGTTFLGIVYMEGRGTAPDYYLAKSYFDSALRQLRVLLKANSAEEELATGSTPIQNFDTSIIANYGLATMIQQGLGMPKDPEKALHMYREIIVALGANGATAVLRKTSNGPRYQGELSVITDSVLDLVTAMPFKHVIDLKLLKASYYSNNKIAKEYVGKTLYQIGMAYKMGIGTGKKRGKAKKFLEKAVEFGNEEAMQALEGLE
ncbi:hypothetical protein ASB1_14450 [Helicobacter heilmannii]|uniref:beta-lactamase n=1 Tax=Helicobacter heilmannii TaxID=35817 RepID=A0A0K2Y4I3_HELHE|nr:SEL1-like repeat protein [Helicobacter heilmannii]BDQ27769.1 hypothetical protein ASB1_14450 [Helicobacter heilmannii]CCM10927.1 hypothetical protein BN341_18410 [Helicobacter heilmannii ASB1.4]CRI33688.1 putative secreted protein [Helicobacter heilmannii]